jgi:hypothetical protein
MAPQPARQPPGHLGALCGKRTAEGVKVVADALVEGNGNAKTIATRKRK